jgi:NO-binding membrane sensor protein with MHYT domain
MKLVVSILLLILGQVISFFQLQGHMKYEWFKNNLWAGVLLGLPISAIFMLAISLLVKHYDGQLWPSRIIGFSIGTMVYAGMSYWLFKEPITTKTLICLVLCLAIILVQILWK